MVPLDGTTETSMTAKKKAVAKKKPVTKKRAAPKSKPTKSLTEPKFTDKQIHFMKEYVVHHNATRAATSAGYSKKTAYSQGQRLLKNVEVAAMIEKVSKAIAAKQEVRAEDVIRETRNIAFANMLDYMAIDDNGNPFFDLSRINRDTGSVIRTMKTKKTVRFGKDGQRTEETQTEITLYDKLAALDKLDIATGAFKKNEGNVEAESNRTEINVITYIPGAPGSAVVK